MSDENQPEPTVVVETNIQEEEDEIIIHNPAPAVTEPVVEPEHEREDDIINDVITKDETITDDNVGEDIIDSGFKDYSDEVTGDDDTGNTKVQYPAGSIDMRGESLQSLVDLLKEDAAVIGVTALDTRVKTVGSWENIIYRSLNDISLEDNRVQDAISELDKEERSKMNHVLRNDDGKIVLRTSSFRDKGNPGEVRNLTGDAAILAFECQESGGGFRLPLYNSGITIDLISPTGNDIQTLLANCINVDREFGSGSGAHYFAYNDVVMKNQIINFINPLIINSSYIDWKKKNKLWSIIKLPDITTIIMTVAALCHKEGYDDFMSRCTRPISDQHPVQCQHVEKFKANLFEMIITRFSAMPKESIDFIVNARIGNVKSTLAHIAKYQSNLGLEGEVVSFDNIRFIMKIPSVSEYLEQGSIFLSDIKNEIQGDNTAGQYEQVGLRYIRTFIPWIASIEKTGSNGSIVKTSEISVITRELEKIDQKTVDEKFYDILRKYVNKSQLTYVGYPVVPCPSCGYVADTPSGMWTFDPFSAFFTLAFRSTMTTE